MERNRVLSLNDDLDILMDNVPLNLFRDIVKSNEVYNNVDELLIKYNYLRMISYASQVEYKLYAGKNT